jgi:glutamine cyclotransferase
MARPGVAGRIGLMMLLSVAGCQVAVSTSAPVASFTVVHAYPHDQNAFTQGLEFLNGELYESTGLNGRSSIREVELETGRVIRRRSLPVTLFGEGLTVWQTDLVQLTWRGGLGFVYDRATFEPKRTFTYAGEGWGLTHDDHSLIMSDGTADIRFLDPVTFRERRRITVVDGRTPVRSLNELEYVNSEIYANVWQTDRIVRIDPASGRVTGWIDLAGLKNGLEPLSPDAVLNGIAYDAAHDRLFVTGKLWPRLFEIRVQ